MVNDPITPLFPPILDRRDVRRPLLTVPHPETGRPLTYALTPDQASRLHLSLAEWSVAFARAQADTIEGMKAPEECD